MSCHDTQRSGHGLAGCCSAPGLAFRCAERIGLVLLSRDSILVTIAAERHFEDSIGSWLLGSLAGRCLDSHTESPDFDGRS